MADMLAKQTMDRKQSIREDYDIEGHSQKLYEGLRERLTGDVGQWMEHIMLEER
jgi:hypothetical protein